MAILFTELYQTIRSIALAELETAKQAQLRSLETQLTAETERLRLFDERMRRTRRPLEDRISRLTQQINTMRTQVSAETNRSAPPQSQTSPSADVGPATGPTS